MRRPSTAATVRNLGARPPRRRYLLRLYVAGTSARSARAIQNARDICAEYLADRHELDVIDIFQQPGRARDDQIVAVPTLLKRSPGPVRRIVGDLSERRTVLGGLDLLKVK